MKDTLASMCRNAGSSLPTSVLNAKCNIVSEASFELWNGDFSLCLLPPQRILWCIPVQVTTFPSMCTKIVKAPSQGLTLFHSGPSC
jgi:hypothetical protein